MESSAGALGPAFLFPERAAAQQKTLKILQWSHFVPAYDKWFDNTFTKEWGEKHNTNVMVDHINLADINARAAAEVTGQEGATICSCSSHRRRRMKSRSST